MSEILVLADARIRGIALPTGGTVAQAILDGTEDWLTQRIGLLAGERTERFFVGLARTHGRLGLARYADPETVAVDDGGSSVAADKFRLVARGSAIVRTYTSASRWWTGPYVEVTYEPAFQAALREALYSLLALAGDEAGSLTSETMGDYSYTRSGSANVRASRAAIVSSLLPRRDAELTLYSRGRPLNAYDPVINRAEPVW